jgi:hypothetical protein
VLLPLVTAGSWRACCHGQLAVVPHLGRWGPEPVIDGDLIPVRQAGEGAHHVLQIRAMIASEAWESQWQNAVLSALKAAV